jgi:hypothetical protein
MRILSTFVIMMLVVLPVLCREASPQEEEQAQHKRSVVDQTVPNLPASLLELPLIEGEDCAEFRELALSGDRALIEAYLACID